ncbi:hypothetical protein VUR80DRAFT_9724 [Thermomyces stellatus]
MWFSVYLYQCWPKAGTGKNRLWLQERRQRERKSVHLSHPNRVVSSPAARARPRVKTSSGGIFSREVWGGSTSTSNSPLSSHRAEGPPTAADLPTINCLKCAFHPPSRLLKRKKIGGKPGQYSSLVTSRPLVDGFQEKWNYPARVCRSCFELLRAHRMSYGARERRYLRQYIN